MSSRSNTNTSRSQVTLTSLLGLMAWSAALAASACTVSDRAWQAADGGSPPLAGGGADDGGTGQGDGGARDGNGGETGNPGPALPDGFDFPVTEGSWWEYQSTYKGSFVGTTGSASYDDERILALTLGHPSGKGDELAYPIQFTVLEATSAPASVPKWNWISFTNRRIRVSTDGAEWSVLFDANTGVWPATSSGMFGDFPSAHGVRRAVLEDSLWFVGEANSSNDCENVPGYGTLCGSGSVQNDAGESYDSAIGLVESHFRGSSSGTSGNGSTTSETTLLDSSVDGARPAPTPGADCVDLPIPEATVDVVTIADTKALPAIGGTPSDGTYAATAAVVLDPKSPAGTAAGKFGGMIKLAGASIEMTAMTADTDDLGVTGYGEGAYFAKGAFEDDDGDVSITYSCSFTGPGSSGPDIAVIDADTFVFYRYNKTSPTRTATTYERQR